MDPVKVGKVICSEKWKGFLSLKASNSVSKKILDDNMEQWCSIDDVNAT